MAGDSEENKSSDHISYKGSVSGLRGFLTSKITQIAGAVASSQEPENADGSRKIPVALIYPNPEQPRQVFEPKALEELATTMKEVGQAQAISVRPKGDGYEIISGERRYRAARLAGITHLECVVKEVSDKDAQLLALVENLQRQDLLPVEEAHYLKRVLKENPGLSLDRLGKMLGTHKSTLSEKIQLTEIPEDEQRLLYAKGKSFTHRHWRVLSRITDAGFLKTLFRKAVEEQLSVSDLEKTLELAGVPKRKTPRAEKKTKASVVWQSPVITQGEIVQFKGATIRLADLSPERREQLVDSLNQVLDLLERTREPIQNREFERAPELQL